MEINFTIEETGLIAHLVARVNSNAPIINDFIVDKILYKIYAVFPDMAGYREWNLIFPGIYCADYSSPSQRIEEVNIYLDTNIVTPESLRNYLLGAGN